MGDWQHPRHYTPPARQFAERVRAAEIGLFVEGCLPALRDTARTFGYALAVHGSERRDLDLVAIPWIEGARPPEDLVRALAARTKELTGWGMLAHEAWTEKPHGRVATTIIASAEVHLDLSVMPLVAKPEEPNP